MSFETAILCEALHGLLDKTVSPLQDTPLSVPSIPFSKDFLARLESLSYVHELIVPALVVPFECIPPWETIHANRDRQRLVLANTCTRDGGLNNFVGLMIGSGSVFK